MALKNVRKHFILWPKQGNKIGGVVLNKVRVSNSKRLTYTQILVEFPPGIYAIQNRVCQKWSARVLKWREKGLSSWYTQCLLTYTFESVDEILKCDHSNESNWAELSCGTVYYAVQGGSYFCVCGWNPQVWPFKWKQLSSTFQPYYLYTVQSCSNFCLVDDILKCDHSNESYWAFLSFLW